MAEVRFSCPHCQAKLHVGEQYVGRAVKCSKCSQVSEVPVPMAEEAGNDEVVLAQYINPLRRQEAF